MLGLKSNEKKDTKKIESKFDDSHNVSSLQDQNEHNNVKNKWQFDGDSYDRISFH